ncbi:MAG: universal stress protein [Sandaracinaceae bacterium]|nr:universal stress protein [Sandaracinaceae bacterium]
MEIRQPVVLALPLDETLGDLVDQGQKLAHLLGTQLVPVHALSRMPARAAFREEETRRARDRIDEWLREPASKGVPIAEPVIESADPAGLVLRMAEQTGAQLIVAGDGRGTTVQEWLVGSTADTLVRHARVPVFIARGTLPGPDNPVMCPVDGSPHAQTGLFAAIRMARVFHAPLRIVTAVDTVHSWFIHAETLDKKADELESIARAETERLLGGLDTSGVEVTVDVRAGQAAKVILEASKESFLLVLASRSFDHLVPMSTTDVTERVVRHSRCSVLCVRDAGTDHEARGRALSHIAELREKALARKKAGDHAAAVDVLRVAVSLAPVHAGLAEELADALELVGKPAEAAHYREVAAMTRERLG